MDFKECFMHDMLEKSPKPSENFSFYSLLCVLTHILTENSIWMPEKFCFKSHENPINTKEIVKLE